MSIEELRTLAGNLRKEGLNSQQIADELSLSQDTIAWLLAGSGGEEKPLDVSIGWRTIGVRPQRIAATGAIMADVAAEECGDTHDALLHQKICGKQDQNILVRPNAVRAPGTQAKKKGKGKGKGKDKGKDGLKFCKFCQSNYFTSNMVQVVRRIRARKNCRIEASMEFFIARI